MTVRSTGPSAVDRATSDSAPLGPTATGAAAAAGHVTVAEITELLHDLARIHCLRQNTGADPTDRAVFLARKADLLTRIADQHAHAPADPPPLTPEGRTS